MTSNATLHYSEVVFHIFTPHLNPVTFKRKFIVFCNYIFPDFEQPSVLVNEVISVESLHSNVISSYLNIHGHAGTQHFLNSGSENSPIARAQYISDSPQAMLE